MNKEIILLNNKVKMLEERYIENRHDCKKLENWLIILGGAIVMLGILLAFQYIDNSKNGDYTSDPHTFCQHYNMNHHVIRTPAFQSNIDECYSIANDSITNTKTIEEIDNRWVFKNE